MKPPIETTRDPRIISVTQRMIWSVQREIWENRSLYIAPLLAALVFLIGFLIGQTIRHPFQKGTVGTPYLFAAGFIMASTLVVAVIYSLDALYGSGAIVAFFSGNLYPYPMSRPYYQKRRFRL
jgi:membrane-associated phospholipid phosphatase